MLTTDSNPTPTAPSVARTLDAWELLDRCGQDLQACPDVTGQIRITLETIRRLLHADAVCWYPGSTRQPLEVVGRGPIALEALHALLGDGEPGMETTSRVCFAHLSPDAACSWALVRMSRTRSVWIVALTTDPARQFGDEELRLMALARRLLLNQRQQARSREQLSDALLGLVRSLAAAINAKSPYTWGHSERVARTAVLLGRSLKLPAADLSNLYLAGLLHDIGKIGIRSELLDSPAPLSDAERKHIEEHPAIGDRILANVPALAALRPGVRHHHERPDGRGYPDGLAGAAIPMQARILAVADACDALVSPRPYRPALPLPRVEAILAEGAGSQWDAGVIQHFLTCRRELFAIYQKGLGDSLLVAVTDVLRAGDEE